MPSDGRETGIEQYRDIQVTVLYAVSFPAPTLTNYIFFNENRTQDTFKKHTSELEFRVTVSVATELSTGLRFKRFRALIM